MPQPDPLIHTKLRPPFIRAEQVARPRLVQQVVRGLRGPLTLITAPAGFGKTTLAAAGVAASGLAAAWLSLDKDDNHAGRFLRYLAAALREAGVLPPAAAVQLIEAAPQAKPELVLTSLVNELQPAGGAVLVLDDTHLVTNPAVHEALAFVLEHCPPGLHLLLASRSDPPLPLARLRARGQVLELRAADLRFNRQEAAQFFNEAMGLDLDPAAVALLEERTEGWAAGLQLAALSMRGQPGLQDWLRGFSGANRYILDYLVEEVLAHEPQAVQSFLLQTAVLERMSGPLCDALTGMSGGQVMLEQLERRSLFVTPLDEERRWYRYHPLFADLLRARLYQDGPGQAQALLARAADWCESAGLVTEAVNYAFASQRSELAAGLVARHWHEKSNNGEVETAWSWLQALPPETVRASAPLSAACCWVLWLAGRHSEIEPHLVHAEDALACSGVLPGDPALVTLPSELAALRSFVTRTQGDCSTAVMLAGQALALLPAGLPPALEAQLRSLIHLARATALDGAGELAQAAADYEETIRFSRLVGNLAGVSGTTYRLVGEFMVLGRLRIAESACRQALQTIERQGQARLPAAGILHLALAEVLVERNQLQQAAQALDLGSELGKWSGRLDAVKNAAPALSRIRMAQGDPQGALEAVRLAEAALSEPLSPLARCELAALRARLYARQGAGDEAAAWADQALRAAGSDRGQSGEKAALAAWRARLEVDPDAANVLAPAAAAAEQNGRLGSALELHFFHALALARQGDFSRAQQALVRSLTLAQPEGYARVYLDEGSPAQDLLARTLAHLPPGPLRACAAGLLRQFEAELPAPAPGEAQPAAAQSALPEPLSPRELEVLRLMALGRTNPQIARELVVAPGTIKAHAASIYRKLDAPNRTAAVTRARQLGLVP